MAQSQLLLATLVKQTAAATSKQVTQPAKPCDDLLDDFCQGDEVQSEEPASEDRDDCPAPPDIAQAPEKEKSSLPTPNPEAPVAAEKAAHAPKAGGQATKKKGGKKNGNGKQKLAQSVMPHPIGNGDKLNLLLSHYDHPEEFLRIVEE